MDAATLTVFAHLLAAAAEEMGTVLEQTAVSPNIRERRDFSAAVFDREGRLLAQAAHIPVHLGSAALSVQAVRAAFPLAPGDCAVLNDPYAGGTHLPDLTLVAPVYHGGTPHFYVATRAHHADVGGAVPGSLPPRGDLYAEGLRLPPLKLRRRGRWHRDVLALLLANVRTPAERHHDLEAQVAATERGVRAIRALLARHGPARMEEAARALLAYTARRTRAVLKQLPPGRYTARDVLEGEERDYPVQVTLTLRAGRLRVDFTGTHPQVPEALNAPPAVTRAAVFYVLRCLLDPELPTNDGILAAVTLQLPPRTLVNPEPPAPVAGGNVETSQRLVDLLFRALHRALPQVPAASQGTMNNVTLGGVDPRTGCPFTYYETLPGGSGASPLGPGESAIQCHMTNTRMTPAEVLEHEFPLRVRRIALRRNSGGAGRHRGGEGMLRELELLAPMEIGLLTDRRRHGPYGLRGGEPGRPGRNCLRVGGRWRTLPGKAVLRAPAGAVLRVETPGGGGYGRKKKT